MTAARPLAEAVSADKAVHNIAVVGCGGVSAMHFDGYTAHPERLAVVAVCDPVPEHVEWARTTYGIARAYTSLDSLISDGGWDTAVVCTPSHVRKQIIEPLAAAGKHILVEKPLADSYADARELVDICTAAGVRLAVNQNFRDHYAFGIARKVIAAGSIGRVLGIAHQDLMFRQDKGWRIRSEWHSMAVMGVHWFDGFRYMLPQEANWISCRAYSSPAVECVGDTDAFVQILFGDTTVSYVQSFSSRFPRTETLVFGEKGTLRLDYDRVQLTDHDGTTTQWQNPHSGAGKPETAYRSLERLLDAVETDSDPSNSGRDNLATIRLLDAAYQSARLRQPVSLAEGGQ